MSDIDRALADADAAANDADEWLTVQEFASRYKMEPKSVYEAIRKGRLAFEVVRLTTGAHARTIRIGKPKAA